MKYAVETWPAAGITGPGSWGTRDGLAWERVEGDLVMRAGGFVAGVIARRPADARRAMRAALPVRGGALATRDGRPVVELVERVDAEALDARRRFAALSRSAETNWRAVEDTPDARRLSVDFYDVPTGHYGQALTAGGVRGAAWHQAPRGERPVLLVYTPKWKARTRQSTVIVFKAGAS